MTRVPYAGDEKASLLGLVMRAAPGEAVPAGPGS
jgi:hypothetical protein